MLGAKVLGSLDEPHRISVWPRTTHSAQGRARHSRPGTALRFRKSARCHHVPCHQGLARRPARWGRQWCAGCGVSTWYVRRPRGVVVSMPG